MPESASKLPAILVYLALSLGTLLVFRQVHSFDFVDCDDSYYVYDNVRVLSGISVDNITWAFTNCYNGYWQPVTWLSLMVDCRLFGPNPGWFHIVNVLLHLVNTLLLFAVLRKMTGSFWPSAFVAAVFAIHPMHVESVAWIAERKDVLSTLFMLLSLAAYTGYARGRSVPLYIASLGLFAVGLMAKPMLVTLPFLMLLLDYWPLDRFAAQAAAAGPGQTPSLVGDKHKISSLIIEKIPFFTLSAASGIITFLTQQAGAGVLDTGTIPVNDRLYNTCSSYATYIGRMFWPHDLAAFYPSGTAGSFRFLQFVLYILLLAGITLFVLRLRNSQKYLAVGWFWFLGTLIPTTGLVRFTVSSYGDRFTYIPYIGLFIMAAWGLPKVLSKLPQHRTVTGLLMAISLTILGFCAYVQTGYWSDSLTLYSHAIEVTKDNDVACKYRGITYAHLGRWPEAIEDLSRAIAIRSDYDEAYAGRGVAYSTLGRPQEAIEDFSRAIQIRPDYAEAYNNRGSVYSSLGRDAQAMEDFSRAIQLRPDWAEPLKNRGMVFSRLGLRHEAVDDFRTAAKLRPDMPEYMNNLAFTLATDPDNNGRQANEAIALATRACEMTGNSNPAFLGTLAAAYASASRFGDAVETVRKAIALADAAGQSQLSDIIRYHLSLYQQGKPLISPQPVTDTDSP